MFNHRGATATGLVAVALIQSACATQPKNMQSQYVSELQYTNYDCSQIAMESDRISRRTNELYASLEKTADNDAAQMGLGLVLFWPALFFLEGGDGPQAAEYTRLKGERDAIERAGVQKKCGIAFVPLMSTPTLAGAVVPVKDETAAKP